jgi:hypothetical protein
LQHRKQPRSDEDFDTARDPWLPPDQPGSFESEHHLVERGRTDSKVSLQIGFGGRSSEDACIGVDERQILTLLWRESWGERRRRHQYMVYADVMRGKYPPCSTRCSPIGMLTQALLARNLRQLRVERSLSE